MKLRIDEQSLPRIQRWGMLGLAVALTLVLGGYFTLSHRLARDAARQEMESVLLLQQETLLKTQVLEVASYLEHVRSRTETVLKTQIRDQVEQALLMLHGLYREYRHALPEAQLRRMLVEALRPVRFLGGRGYYFIDDLQGNCVLLPTAPEREGSSLLDNRDDQGHYIMRGLLAAVDNPEGAGFSRYRWYAPGRTGMHDKIAYVARFAPYDWIVGTGEYIFKVEEDLQAEALARIRALRFGADGYIAVLDREGTPLVSPSRPDSENRPLHTLPAEEQEVIRAIMRKASAGGGLLRYDWINLRTGKIEPKLAFVHSIPAWNWVLVSGIHMGEIEASLARQRANLEQELQQTLLVSSLVLALALLLALVYSGLYSRWFRHLFERYRTSLEASHQALYLNKYLMDHAADMCLLLDHSGRVIYSNRSAQDFLGQPDAPLTGQTWQELPLPPLPLPEVAATTELTYTDPAGRQRHLEARLSPADYQGSAYFCVILRDISQRREQEERLRHLREHDPLTDLPNRNLLHTRLSQAIAHTRQSARALAVLWIDLDRFKLVNDSLGHPVGDRVLTETAMRLQGLLRARDTISRHGADEFVVVLVGLDHAERAALIARKIQDRLAAPFVLDGQELTLTTSIGIALFPSDGADADSLLKNAEAAMYHAKQLGRNNCQFFTAEINERFNERLKLEHGLRHALQAGELQLHYQPQFSLQDGRIRGCEALLRWESPQLGWVAPARFIPVAEDSGLIVSIGDWVLAQVCARIADWQARGLPLYPVAVNVSALQFKNGSIVQSVAQALRSTGIPAGLLELEVTESVLAHDTERICEQLRTLKAMGVKLAIDDFGTGYSSLSYLKRFPLDRLKIDRSFIQDLPEDQDDAAITLAIIEMARALGLSTLAEGVETPAQRDYLFRQGCEQVQGYLYAKPMPEADFVALIAQSQPA